MSFFDFLKRGGDNQNLQDKVTALEAVIEKSALADSLGYVSGGNYYEYNLQNTSKAYKNNYTVYRAINMLADMLAQLPMRLYRGKQELPIDFVFPNGFSMAKPNPSMSLNELLYKSAVYYFFHGEYINHIVDDGILRLEVVNPKNAHRNPDGTWRLNENNSLNVIVQNDQLIYNPLFDPTITNYNDTMDRGLSPIDVVRSEVSADSSAGLYITKFFENYGQVGGTLIDKDGGSTKDEMKRTVAEFNSIHQSKSKAYKTIGLAGGMEYKELSQTMREMQFLDSRKDIRDKILAVLGIHKALFGVTDQVNRSVMEEATRQVWVQTLKPKAIRIQEKYNQQFFNHYFPGYYVKWDFSEISELQDSMENILKQCVEFKKLGYTTNEVNTHFGLKMEPIKDEIGDMRFVPIYLKTLEQVEAKAVTPDKTPTKDVLDALDKVMAPAQVSTEEKELRAKLKTFLFEQRKKVLKIVNTEGISLKEDLKILFNDEDARLEGITSKDLNKSLYNQVKLQVLVGLDKGEDISTKIRDLYNYMEKQIKKVAKEEMVIGV